MALDLMRLWRGRSSSSRTTAGMRHRSKPVTSAMLMSHCCCLTVWWIVCCTIILQPQGTDSQDLNTPPLITVDRHWRIRENTTLGTIIARVHADDNEDDTLEFGMDALVAGQDQPFTIDPQSGIVTLNKSVEGRAGQNFFVYVTVTDGSVTSKNEVYVNILASNATGLYKSRVPQFTPSIDNIRQILPPGFNLPGMSSRPQVPLPLLPPQFTRSPPTSVVQPQEPDDSYAVTPLPTKQTKTYPDRPLVDGAVAAPPEVQGDTTLTDSDGNLTIAINGGTGNTTKLSIPSRPTTIRHPAPTVASHPTVAHTTDATHGPVLAHPASAAGSEEASTFKILLPVIISVTIIFVSAGLIAICIFRKYLCAISKTLKKKNKIDKAKKSNQSNASSNITSGTEDSRNSIGLSHWSGPMAFSNRYTSPWERDASGHLQATSQLSEESNASIPKDRWEFPRHRLKVFNILGEGAFGQVWRCEATDIDGHEGVSITAVKTLKENASEAERSDLLSELQVLKSLEPHINVVRLLGCCTEKDPIFVILEYVNMGKLQTFLRNSRVEKHYGNTHGKSKILTSGDLTSFMFQVARGMDFLTSRGIIHRDLAARNILITEDHTCKVADFGFARDIVTSKVYERKSEGRLPIRWMATESLYDNIFTVKSDIWSFGILMWEIVTLGSTPYPGIAAADVMRKVRDGYRLEKPEHCRRELYNIMFYCWAGDPDERPGFPEVVEMLDRLLQTETDYIELERFPDHNYYNMLNMSGEKL
ncbi:tyrosine kinase receptor Cad96Ca [Anopheles aquasalis]|uniref:tyrosine kinase receptor Cad96Ca n=1 Tax=Anopheles aquasalis TaxID=42839 RepID=UPI00215AFFD0|nr:tyrosine kinase receptor Cad96Ca [Anopheles aquasalis]XP_050090792.1 tyrosine kinase receptor Cad96Ca [Anopheles aquasalis]XP_050090793.1 tyrosine kinase receptor Cad96Ca [Anopheles aquasalis]XP_050090794.1 tyrosine kinase receptor Cad96Ca [Anopheles aquasalis]XP_050090795.1 tyrosine kinase receptor Cad96Ca [Anopheles aquasalis]